jgi:fructose-1,6-bisphosphatase/inositol monophosphatase family enzyme
VSEELLGRTAEYGSPDAGYLDPLDGTRDFVENHPIPDHLKQSAAAFSLGIAVDSVIERGVVNLPLIRPSHMYWAEHGHTYRIDTLVDDTQLKIDTSATKHGVVLVTDGEHRPHMDALKQMNFRVVQLSAAVFKACAVVDPQLIHEYDPDLLDPDERVVGFVSRKTYAHDYAATSVIAKNAGAFARAADGSELPLTEGRHGCVFANSEEVGYQLLEALATDLD